MLKEIILQQDEEVEVEMEIKRSEAPKTNPQLHYYFGIVVTYCLAGFIELGWDAMDKDKCDFELRKLFFSEDMPNKKTGKVQTFIKSLSSADIKEVSLFIDNCIRFAAQDLMISIPPPPPKNQTFTINNK